MMFHLQIHLSEDYQGTPSVRLRQLVDKIEPFRKQPDTLHHFGVTCLDRILAQVEQDFFSSLQSKL